MPKKEQNQPKFIVTLEWQTLPACAERDAYVSIYRQCVCVCMCCACWKNVNEFSCFKESILFVI